MLRVPRAIEGTVRRAVRGGGEDERTNGTAPPAHGYLERWRGVQQQPTVRQTDRPTVSHVNVTVSPGRHFWRVRRPTESVGQRSRANTFSASSRFLPPRVIRYMEKRLVLDERRWGRRMSREHPASLGTPHSTSDQSLLGLAGTVDNTPRRVQVVAPALFKRLCYEPATHRDGTVPPRS